MDDKQKRLEDLKARLQNVSYDDFEAGLPYNDAYECARGYDEYVECLGIVEEAGRTRGLPEKTLSELRAAYEATFYPHQYDYIIKDGRKISTIAPQNASEGAALTQFRIGERTVNFDFGPYCFKGEELYCLHEESLELVSSHPIMPIGVIINPDMTEKLVIWFKRFGITKTIEEPRVVVFDKKKIKKLINYGVDVNPALVEFFTQIEILNRGINPGFETIVEATHMGWINDSCSAFFPYDRKNYRCSIISDFRHEYDSVNSVAGTFEGWLEAVNQFRDPDHIAVRIALAASFASALIKPLETLPVILHIWGTKSGSGKTVALTTAASIWANPMSGRGFLASLNTTIIAMARRAQFFCSFPLCDDELQTVRNKKDLQDMIYVLSQGEPRGLPSRSGVGIRDLSSWKNTIMTSGEQSILSWTVLAGAQNRVIEIPCGDNYLFSDDAETMTRYINQLKENHNHAGRRFIEHLKEPGNIDHVRSLYNGFITALKRQATNKQILAAAAILTADNLACDWIFRDEMKLTIEDLLPYLKGEEDVDAGNRMQEYIYEWIATNKPSMIRSEKPGKITTVKGRRICAIPTETFRDLMADKGYDTRAYFSWAVEHDMAIRDDDGKHFDRRITVNGVSIRCACIVMPPEDE